MDESMKSEKHKNWAHDPKHMGFTPSLVSIYICSNAFFQNARNGRLDNK